MKTATGYFTDSYSARAKAREWKVYKLVQALSLACKIANETHTANAIRRADEIRTRLVDMGELPETSR